MNKTLIIMAAGMGSRYGGLKQLDRIGPSGETIIDYSAFDAIRAGFGRIVFVIREDFNEAFREQIGSKIERYAEVDYVFQNFNNLPGGYSVPAERTKPLGTGHAMLAAEPVTPGSFLVINADDYYGPDAFRKAATFLDDETGDSLRAALVGFYLKNTLSPNGSVARGVCTARENMTLAGVTEALGIIRNQDGSISSDNCTGLTEDTIVSMNMWAFSRSVFDYTRTYLERFLKEKRNDPKAEFYIPFVVDTLIKEESLNVRILETASEWFGVTYKEDRPQAEACLASLTRDGLYPERLWGER